MGTTKFNARYSYNVIHTNPNWLEGELFVDAAGLLIACIPAKYLNIILCLLTQPTPKQTSKTRYHMRHHMTSC